MGGKDADDSIMANDGECELLMTVPADCGLLITFEEMSQDSTNGNGKGGNSRYFRFEATEDRHFPSIHPNAYGPADLTNLHVLKGGGSGVTVFGADHPELGAVVLKHSGPKDLREVFSLCSLAHELSKRSTKSSEAAAAGQAMKRRIPAFKMLYISSFHLRDRAKEQWTKLRRSVFRHFSDLTNNTSDSSVNAPASSSSSSSSSHHSLHSLPRTDSNCAMRRIRLLRTPNSKDSRITVHTDCMDIILHNIRRDTTTKSSFIAPSDSSFHHIVMNDLYHHQSDHLWKFSLGQKRIGDMESENGAFLHTQSKLAGRILETLQREYIAVIRDLEELTLDDERHGVEKIKLELERLPPDEKADSVSLAADSFVGKAILKNFASGGRFEKLRRFGKLFREGNKFHLLQEEEEPARFLGMALERGCNPSANPFFETKQIKRTALDAVEDDGWRLILEEAVACRPGPATENLWTCGLTDGGLHNLFVSQDDLWLFDLGEQNLMPAPAFLTKFLMSFFHTLGMEETDDGRIWVHRFKVNEKGQFTTTRETRDLEPKVREIFIKVLELFVTELFDDDPMVRSLMLRYVVLQLLSDGAFCLERWKLKGGGSYRVKQGPTSTRPALDRWLWRALWDIFIATYVYHSLLKNRAD